MPASHTPFAVFNRTGNPIIRAVLRSPLHPLLSRQLALITVTGRRSGRTFTIPVGYQQDGSRVTVGVGWPQRKRWWRNLRQGGRVGLRLRGRDLHGEAVARGDETSGVTVEIQLDAQAAGEPAR
jgi:hypothetical protein